MSNFFKQYNVIEEQSDIRVIDYNKLAQEKLKKLVKQQKAAVAGVDADGFQSLDSIVPEEVMEDPAEVLQNAKDEADKILSEARKRSDDMMNDAYQKSEGIKTQAKEEGYADGYREGEVQIRAELEEEYNQKKAELEEYRVSLDEKYKQKLNELEPMLLDTILTVVEKVFHIQYKDKKDILLYLIENTIQNVEGCKNFRIRVGEEQKTFLERRKDDILDQIGHDMTLEIIADPAFLDDQCIIETDTGVFDCGTGVQLENLVRDLRTLSS